MEEYNLLGNKWLSDMYEIRHRWIPSYFKDVEFCGLMRTTSRSESENSFFNSFTHYGDTLIQFMFSFSAAMDKQRYIQETLDHQTKNTTPKYKTPLNIEKHAAKCRACKNRLCHARTFFHRDYNGHIFARSDGYAGGRNK